MSTECRLCFQPLGQREVVGAFDEGTISSTGGSTRRKRPSGRCWSGQRVIPLFPELIQTLTEAAQKAAQCALELRRMDQEAEDATLEFPEEYGLLLQCTSVHADGEGFDAVSVSADSQRDLRQTSPESAAKCAATPAQVLEIPPDLGVVVDSWPHLPPAARREILGVIRRASDAAAPAASLGGFPGPIAASAGGSL